MRLRDSSSLGKRICLGLAFWVTGTGMSPKAAANCLWVSSPSAMSTPSGIQFTGLAKWLSKTLWVDEQGYPVGTLMALSTVSLRPEGCSGLTDIRNRLVDFVYMPPANATRIHNGFLLPARAAGAALRLEFPRALGAHPAGILIHSSTGTVAQNGLLHGNFLPWLDIRIALVKTGAFDPFSFSSSSSDLAWPDGLGWVRYFPKGEPNVHSLSETPLAMGPSAAQITGVPGVAVGAACRLRPTLLRGEMQGARRNMGAANVVRLESVKATDFNGFGPIEKGAQQRFIAFHCVARSSSEISVYFDATFPFGGVDGVGMPGMNSDVGVQILLSGEPVQFGSRSMPLRWRFEPSVSFPGGLDGKSIQGRFCIAGCADDTSLTNPNWREGDGGAGNNEAMEAPVTFRYFQTSQHPPVPRSFSVPFTITLDWH